MSLEKIDWQRVPLWLALANVFIQPSFPSAIVFVAVAGLRAFVVYLDHLQEAADSKNHDLNMVMLQNQIDSILKEFESVAKTAEDAKKLLSQSNLALSFSRSQRQ